ncbi:MAG: alkaline phosphatase family protein [Planctomycetes bacterium]|nr:alkaline phosphatase family protein [Planctomycetota bacterium]
MRWLALLLLVTSSLRAQRETENVLLVTLDGLRWQDVFTGADNRMLDRDNGGVRDLRQTRREFWRGAPEVRRQLLMPFLWGVIAQQGQVFGDPEADARAVVTNPHKFSYPGYSELLCGLVDETIASNNKFPNPNTTVLGFLHGRPGFAGRVAAFSGWDVHEYIVNEQRSGIFCEVAWEPVTVATSEQRLAELNRMAELLPRYWGEGFCFDLLTYERSREYLLAKRPRVLYVAFGETDEWAHSRRYDLYLQMARRGDEMVRDLWQTMQQLDQYRGKTSLVLTVDHGRGRTPRDWTDHNADVDGAEEVWMAVMGPDTPALGVRKGVRATQAMIASTVAALLGEDFRSAVPNAAAPLPGVIRE